MSQPPYQHLPREALTNKTKFFTFDCTILLISPSHLKRWLNCVFASTRWKTRFMITLEWSLSCVYSSSSSHVFYVFLRAHFTASGLNKQINRWNHMVFQNHLIRVLANHNRLCRLSGGAKQKPNQELYVWWNAEPIRRQSVDIKSNSARSRVWRSIPLVFYDTNWNLLLGGDTHIYLNIKLWKRGHEPFSWTTCPKVKPKVLQGILSLLTVCCHAWL